MAYVLSIVAFFCYIYTVKKKVREVPVPSQVVTTKLSLGGNYDVITELFLNKALFMSVAVHVRVHSASSKEHNYGIPSSRLETWPWLLPCP